MKKNSILMLWVLLLLNSVSIFAAPTNTQRPATWLMANSCSGCHGSFGHSVGSTPSIAGLSEAVFIKAMVDYKSGARPSTVMDRIARGYTSADFVAMAKFFKNR